MRKIVSLILVIIMVLSMSACAGGKVANSINDDSGESKIEHTGKKIKGEITAASVFSEGLAFVCLDGNMGKIYCIDKQSNIVFEFENNIEYALDNIPIKFEQGYALINDAICDTEGKFVYPEDVEVTKFYDFALKGGYIIAERVVADYNSSKKELGIMNTKFEWVLQPSEKMYSKLEEGLFSATYGVNESFYSDNYIYFSGCRKYLNIETGEVLESIKTRLSSETWDYNIDRTMINASGEVMVNLRNLENIESTGNNTYKNGKIPLVFYNQDVAKRFWTLADEKLNFLFDPIEMVDYSVESYSNWIKFDGEYIVFYDEPTKKLRSYNSNGKFLNELTVEKLLTGYIEDGVILLVSDGTNSKEYRYYNADLTPLF